MRVGDRLDVRGPSAVRFRGTDRTAFLDNRRFHGNAFALLRAAERFLRDSLPIAGRIGEGRVERIDKDCRLAWLDRRLPNGRYGSHYDTPARSWILRALARHTDDDS